MLKASEQEREEVIAYMFSQARRERVQLAQKVYSERIGSVQHDIWDVHTSKGRWWVITSPMFLYSQRQFPNMDLALTFHIGLCVRVPRSDRPTLEDRQLEPLVACWRAFDEATAASEHAEEVEDYQAIGVRCREVMVTLVHRAQDCIEGLGTGLLPKRSDVRGWSAVIADTVQAGAAEKDRRHLLKSSADAAWAFTNWLTHARDARVTDAEAALHATQLMLSLYTTGIIRHLRGVPDRCPSCGSQRLAPERAFDPDDPGSVFERPACQKCSWRGKPVRIQLPPPRKSGLPPSGECSIMDPPLRTSGQRLSVTPKRRPQPRATAPMTTRAGRGNRRG
jgi:hypothetical protein